MASKKRYIENIITELSIELWFDVDFICYGWIIILNINNKVHHIVWYDRDLNNSTSQLIAKDKNACYEILKTQNIPAIEHQLFLAPYMQNYIWWNGNRQRASEYAANFDYQVVCKSNLWTWGNDVYRVTNHQELESYVHKLFNTNRWLCLSPYYEIQNEYRVIVLDNNIELIYDKIRQSVVWDGISTILQIIANNHPDIKISDIDLWKIPLSYILEKWKNININRKHNLGKWWTSKIITEEDLINKLWSLAISSAKAINIRFASVDIAKLADDNFMIIEINSWIMMEKFVQSWNYEYQIAKNIYTKAIKKLAS